MSEHATPTYRELRRSRDDRMLAGVCGGLGRYFDVNPVLYRIGFVVLAVLGGAGILIYGAMALVIPNEGEHDSVASDVLRNHRQRPVALVGLALVAIAGIVLLSHVTLLRIHSDAFWAVVLLAGAVLLWSQRRPRAEAAASAPSAPIVDLAPAPPRRRRRGLRIALATIAILILLAIAGGLAFTAVYLHPGDGIGQRTYRPLTAAALRDEYKLGVGELDVDLSRLGLPPGTTTVHMRVGIGQLHVTVPRGVTVRTLGKVSWGNATVLGHQESGHDVHTDVGAARARLVLDGKVGIGQLEVDRALR
jgi:phage shock protein PspC (stress-responsive transcriptional regulator)